MNIVDELYKEISNHLGITVKEFKDRICSGERLVQYTSLVMLVKKVETTIH